MVDEPQENQEVEIDGDTMVEDVPLNDPDDSVPYGYEVTSYGIDYPVETLIAKLERDDITVPDFQRGYVWRRPQAIRFIESILLGLPIPGIFLFKDDESKLLVLDGQQRLKTLRAFVKGILNERPFRLTKVNERFNNLTYDELAPSDRRKFNDTVIHATIIEQLEPDDDNSSVFYIFERLNTGATLLRPQEIRTAIFGGPFDELLNELNKFEDWRALIGNRSMYSKDKELILRFLAFYSSSAQYSSPMKKFLNKFMSTHKDLDLMGADNFGSKFKETISYARETLGDNVFRTGTAFNAAMFEALMVGLARRLDRGQTMDSAQVVDAYRQLKSQPEFEEAIRFATARPDHVQKRLELATAAFSEIE